MKSTLANNKQLFNIKSIAYNTTLDNLADGETAIFEEGSNTSVVTGLVYATMPDKFRIFSKINGKVYFSLAPIEKAKIYNTASNDYEAEVGNIWQTVIENCDCINSIKLAIGIDEDSLMRRDGLTWAHKDNFVEITPQELACLCDCTGKGVYENNVLTNLMAAKVNASDSSFYTAEVVIEGATEYADLTALNIGIAAPTIASYAIMTDSTGVVDTDAVASTVRAVVGWNGTAWIALSPLSATDALSRGDAFEEFYKVQNTDADLTNDGPLLTFRLLGVVQATPLYRDLEANYIYPRGTRLYPSISMNEGTTVVFTETQELVYEKGAGYDMRAEEFDCMSLYTNLNHAPQLSDGLAHNNLVYQFENATNYDVMGFEFYTDKVEVNNGDKRSFYVGFGVEDGLGTIFAELLAMFIA